jgi:hypothetical protein
MPTSTTSAVVATRATLYTTHFSCSRSTVPERRQRTRSAKHPAARENWKATFTGTAKASSHSGRPTNPDLVSNSLKYSSEARPQSTTSWAHHHREGGDPEGKRTAAVLRAATETTQAFTIHNARVSAVGSPRPRLLIPAARPATIRHQPTGLAGWRQVIG